MLSSEQEPEHDGVAWTDREDTQNEHQDLQTDHMQMFHRSMSERVVLDNDAAEEKSTDCYGGMLTRTTTDTASDETTGRGTEQVTNVDVTKQPVLS